VTSRGTGDEEDASYSSKYSFFFLGLREEGKERKGKQGMSAWGTVKEMGKHSTQGLLHSFKMLWSHFLGKCSFSFKWRVLYMRKSSSKIPLFEGLGEALPSSPGNLEWTGAS